jgi:hypothetical protein
MRPIWDRLSAPQADILPEIAALRALEKEAHQPLVEAVTLASQVGVEVDSVKELIDAAETDLCAGCEVAAAGYFKQAYALWRSWLEQSVFALYFLEAPLHRQAWQVVTEIDSGKEPRAKLMLHELVSENDHPFYIVYESRLTTIHEALKVTNVKKTETALKLTNHCLRDLSQGVHGTFNPHPVASHAELPKGLMKHALPTLQRARTAVGALCFAYAYALIGPPTDQQLVALRSPAPEGAEDEGVARLRPLWPAFDRWLEHLRKPQGGKDGNRG